MEIKKQDIDNLNAEISVNLIPADYENHVNEGIKKVQRQANVPGFRPGKVPVGLIKKQYGTQIMVDEINKLLNETIYKYIEQNNIEILGNPLPKLTTPVDFEGQKEFEFVYEIGLSPKLNFELSSQQNFTFKTVKVDDELIDKYIKDIRRNFGKPLNPEQSGEKDIVFVDINELDETGQIKPGGIFKSTSISFERLTNANAKQKVLGLKKEDKITIDINELYETALDKSVALGIDKEVAETIKCNLQLTVKNIARLEDAELNQELFDKVYGAGVINSIDEFKEKIKNELSLMFSADSDRFLKTEVENKLVDSLNVSLPDNFLKRWLKAVNEKPLSDEQLEKEYPEYAKAMKWRLIENKLIKDNALKVDVNEATDEAKRYIYSEYSRYGQKPNEEEVSKLAKDILSREKEAQRIYENLYSQKVLQLVKEKCTLTPKEVSYDEFFKNN
ncbi:MAG: trigger factor [Bacteroidetes bacterium]|nr:trigger factor [Bacteroidota bacterium]